MAGSSIRSDDPVSAIAGLTTPPYVLPATAYWLRSNCQRPPELLTVVYAMGARSSTFPGQHIRPYVEKWVTLLMHYVCQRSGRLEQEGVVLQAETSIVPNS